MDYVMKLARMHQKLLLALIVMIAAYFPTILWMYDRWIARDSYYSHGFLIPIVSLALIYWNKEELAEIKWKESPWGMRLIIAGAVLHLLASHPNVRIYFVSGFSMLVLICGLVLYLYGEEIFRRILFPLFFLIFMVPMPLVVINKISLQLKMFAAELATMVLNNMGIQALRGLLCWAW